ncbi:MAG: energy transducer TonB [Chitinophagales bacterium]
MKAKFLVISGGILVLAYACNSGTDSKASADTAKAAMDTTNTMAKDTVKAAEAAPAIDSAAVTREYMAAQKKSKKTTAPKPKKQAKNEVVMYAEEPIQSHEVYEAPPPAQPNAAPTVIHTKEYVYFAPSNPASFPGGTKALEEFINKNLQYPERALTYHTQGTVYADVYLDSAGNVTSVEFPADHLGDGLEEETHDILMRSPRWHPAKENGILVKSKVTVPVVYRITH